MSPSGMIRGREGNGTKFLKGTLVTAPSRYPTRTSRCASRSTRTRSAGVSPAEGRARALVAWAAERRETETSEARRQ